MKKKDAKILNISNKFLSNNQSYLYECKNYLIDVNREKLY